MLLSVIYAEVQKDLKLEQAPWEEVAAKYTDVETYFAHPSVPQDDFVQLRAQPVGAEKKHNIEKWLDNNVIGLSQKFVNNVLYICSFLCQLSKHKLRLH